MEELLDGVHELVVGEEHDEQVEPLELLESLEPLGPLEVLVNDELLELHGLMVM